MVSFWNVVLNNHAGCSKKKSRVCWYFNVMVWPATARLWLAECQYVDEGHLWISGATVAINYSWWHASWLVSRISTEVMWPTGSLGWWAWLIIMQECINKQGCATMWLLITMLAILLCTWLILSVSFSLAVFLLSFLFFFGGGQIQTWLTSKTWNFILIWFYAVEKEPAWFKT